MKNTLSTFDSEDLKTVSYQLGKFQLHRDIATRTSPWLVSCVSNICQLLLWWVVLLWERSVIYCLTKSDLGSPPSSNLLSRIHMRTTPTVSVINTVRGPHLPFVGCRNKVMASCGVYSVACTEPFFLRKLCQLTTFPRVAEFGPLSGLRSSFRTVNSTNKTVRSVVSHRVQRTSMLSGIELWSQSRGRVHLPLRIEWSLSTSFQSLLG